MGKDRSPLPLTAFEEYMFRDDRPACPMSMVARLRFGGAGSRSRFGCLGRNNCSPPAAAGQGSGERQAPARMG